MAHDVFISYALKDKAFADAVCAKLEENGIRCWIAPRDILPGQDYAEGIVNAIDGSRLMVLAFSANSNGSEHVKNEVERAVSEGKAILPFRVQDALPSGSLALHLARRHWLDALTPPLEKHLQRLVDTVSLLLSRIGPEASRRKAAPPSKTPPAQPLFAGARKHTPDTPTEPLGQSAIEPERATDAASARPERLHRPSRKRLLSYLLGALVILTLAVCVLVWVSKFASNPTAPRAGDEATSGPNAMTFVYVPAGRFTMGSDVLPRPYLLDERPKHRAYVNAFWIGKYEVTNREFKDFVKATGYSGARRWAQASQPGDENLPARWVSWNDAAAYCTWVGGRLPTEAEWEKAARGTDRRTFPWGNQWDVASVLRCNFADKNTHWWWSDGTADDRFSGPAPVRSFPDGASPYGAYNMSGNVREWCNDWYADGYRGRGPFHNPTGPLSGTLRVVRGGSCGSGRDHLTCSSRGMEMPEATKDDLGFRVAR